MSGSSFPVKSHVFAAVIDDHHTDFSLSEFGNCMFAIVTQYGKIGNISEVQVDHTQDIIDPATVYHIKVLLGEDTEELNAAVRFIAQQLKITKTFYLSLALKDKRPQILKKIVCHLVEHRNVYQS